MRPKFYQGSKLASARDSRNVDKDWQKSKVISNHVNGLTQSVQRVSREVSKMRRRIVGGGNVGGAGLTLRGEYDPAATYSLNDVVVISMGINQGTFVGISNSIPVGTAPYTGGGVWMQLPGSLLGAWF